MRANSAGLRRQSLLKPASCRLRLGPWEACHPREAALPSSSSLPLTPTPRKHVASILSPRLGRPPRLPCTRTRPLADHLKRESLACCRRNSHLRVALPRGVAHST